MVRVLIIQSSRRSPLPRSRPSERARGPLRRFLGTHAHPLPPHSVLRVCLNSSRNLPRLLFFGNYLRLVLKTKTKMAGKGDACYFPRDMGRGSYGGDVHCFQQFLGNKGYLLEEPTGYYGERTATATKRWQVRVECIS